MVLLPSNAAIENNIAEYQYKKSNSPETPWITVPVGSRDIRLVVNPGNSYELFLRYQLQQITVAHYSITVKPYLWQTTGFKIGIACVIALIIAVVVIFMYFQKKKIENIQSEAAQKQTLLELKSIQAQLNPHFVFNSLNSIQGLMNTGRIDEANRYLSEFSRLMRETLHDNDKIFSTVTIEIKKLEQYLKLEQLRFGFVYAIKTDDHINQSVTEIPMLLLQPIVENAIKHGVAHLGAAGSIHIVFFTKNSDMYVTVEDNGKGFVIPENNPGYGIKLTRDRIKLVNSIHTDSCIEQTIKSDGNGTLVTIIFKQWL
jgi:LytS/YehU family sensor histidine kinase